MPQSTIICIDNSESTRNGDFYPSRLLAQQEAVNEIVRVQLQSSLENDVALLSMAGTRPEVLVPLSRSQVALQRKLYSVQLGGIVDPLTTIRVAQLILKHRQGIQHAQRVMVFIGSPLSKDTLKAASRMVPLGQSLRKANISLDFVVFGTAEEIQQTSELFKPFVRTLKDNCQLLTVTSQYSLIDVVLRQMNSLIGSVQAGRPSVITNEDPELALAIQMSLQGMKKDEGTSPAAVTSASTDDPDLLFAIQMSLQDGKQSAIKTTSATHVNATATPKLAPQLVKQTQMGKTDMNSFKGESDHRPSELNKNSNLGASAKGAKQGSKIQGNTPRTSPMKATSSLSTESSASWLSVPSKSNSSSATFSLSSEEASLLHKILASKYYQQLKAKRQKKSSSKAQPAAIRVSSSKTQSFSKTSSSSLSKSKVSNLAQQGKSPTSNKTSQKKFDAKSSETKIKTSLISKMIEEMIITSKAKLNSDSQKVMPYPSGSNQAELKRTKKFGSPLKVHNQKSAFEKDDTQTVQARSERKVPYQGTNLSKQADLAKPTGTDSMNEMTSSSSYSLSSHKRSTSSIKGKSASFKSKVNDSTQICCKANSKVAPAEHKLDKCKATKPDHKHS